MVLIDSDKFSPSDLLLFIESLEIIARIEGLRKQRKQKYRAQLYLDQETNFESSNSPITSSAKPAEAYTMEVREESNIGCNSTSLMENQYNLVDQTDHSNNEENDSLSSQTILYSVPYDSSKSTNLDECSYETLNLSNHQYEEVQPRNKRTKAKRKLSFLGLVCKKYKRCFSNNSGNDSYWHKSDSWTKMPHFGDK